MKNIFFTMLLLVGVNYSFADQRQDKKEFTCGHAKVVERNKPTLWAYFMSFIPSLSRATSPEWSCKPPISDRDLLFWAFREPK